MVKPVSPWLDSKKKHRPEQYLIPFFFLSVSTYVLLYCANMMGTDMMLPPLPHSSCTPPAPRPFDFPSHLSALSIWASPGVSSEASKLIVSSHQQFLSSVASGYTNQPSFGAARTHAHPWSEGWTTGNLGKGEKCRETGVGRAVRQTNYFRPCFQSNPLFVLHDLHS